MIKTPMRTCLGCGEKQPKNEMLRIVKTVDQEIILDKTGKTNGRGCYVCKNESCMANIIKQKKLSRSFEMNVPNEIYDVLLAQFKELVIDGGSNIG